MLFYSVILNCCMISLKKESRFMKRQKDDAYFISRIIDDIDYV